MYFDWYNSTIIDTTQMSGTRVASIQFLYVVDM